MRSRVLGIQAGPALPVGVGGRDPPERGKRRHEDRKAKERPHIGRQRRVRQRPVECVALEPPPDLVRVAAAVQRGPGQHAAQGIPGAFQALETGGRRAGPHGSDVVERPVALDVRRRQVEEEPPRSFVQMVCRVLHERIEVARAPSGTRALEVARIVRALGGVRCRGHRGGRSRGRGPSVVFNGHVIICSRGSAFQGSTTLDNN